MIIYNVIKIMLLYELYRNKKTINFLKKVIDKWYFK